MTARDDARLASDLRITGTHRNPAPIGASLRFRWHRLNDRACRILDPYDAREEDAARFRARQLRTVVRLTPLAVVVNIINALVVVWSLRHTGHDLFLPMWAGMVAGLSLLGLRGWLRGRAVPERPTASRRAIRRSVLQAALLGCAWGVLPAYLFRIVGDAEQFLLGVVTAGMMCAGAFVMSSVPMAGTIWTLTIGIGALIALATSGSAYAGGIMLMLAAYTIMTIFGVWSVARSMGARLMAEARADHQHEVIGLLLRDFEDHASDLLWEIDRNGYFVHASQRLLRLLDVSETELGDVPALVLLERLLPATAEAQEYWQRFTERVQDGSAAFRDQLLTVQTSQGTRWWSVSARRLHDERGDAIGWRGVAADQTEQQLAHRRLAWLAHNDALTGLVNRTQFRDMLQALLGSSHDAPPPLAIVYLDLDGFKQINDQLGHSAGDQLLRLFGERLLAAARRSDSVARLGGDEFAMLLRNTTHADDARPVLDRVLELMQLPCELNGRRVPLRTSMGVALTPQDGTDIDTLMNRADLALYTAKHSGGNTYCFYRAELAASGQRRALVEHALRGAIERQEFRLEYQPQVQASSLALCGFEALLRWTHPELGEVTPSEFVPIAESIGLMPRLGEWVLTEACREAARWPRQLSVSINVSPLQLRDERFVERVLAGTGTVSAHRVELEVTESALVDDASTVVQVLHRLRGHGYRVALDDFGTGYSALGYLRRFPFDVLKIDRSFVRDLCTDPEALVLVDTILAMSRALNMTTVAEGVETWEEAEMLRARGCTVLQGFMVSPPLPVHDVGAFTEAWTPTAPPSPRLLVAS